MSMIRRNKRVLASGAYFTQCIDRLQIQDASLAKLSARLKMMSREAQHTVIHSASLKKVA
jgi:hypothetical protein